ncbi:hypothetical protein AAE478_010003 [Parahypoxylon ruwenzoriense]
MSLVFASASLSFVAGTNRGGMKAAVFVLIHNPENSTLSQSGILRWERSVSSRADLFCPSKKHQIALVVEKIVGEPSESAAESEN